MDKEAPGAVSEAACTAARAAFDFTASLNAAGDFKISLKIENALLAAGFALGAYGLAAFYLRSRENRIKTENAIKDALEQPSAAGVAQDRDPEVGRITSGSILVELLCHTPQSFLQFVSDYESGKVLHRLEREMTKIGFKQDLKISILNEDKLRTYKKHLR